MTSIETRTTEDLYICEDDQYDSSGDYAYTVDQFREVCAEHGWPVDLNALTPLAEYVKELPFDFAVRTSDGATARRYPNGTKFAWPPDSEDGWLRFIRNAR